MRHGGAARRRAPAVLAFVLAVCAGPTVEPARQDLVPPLLADRDAGSGAPVTDDTVFEAASLGLIPAGTKTAPFAWTGGELAFSFTIPLEGGMDIRTRLTAQGATLKGRWEDVKGGNSGPVELALAPRCE